MKTFIKFLKGLTLFITAIWGLLFGVFGSIVMLTDPDKTGEGLPDWIYIMWLIVALIGFIIPCFLVMLKAYKTAAGIVTAGTVALIIMRVQMEQYSSMDTASLYLPLLLSTLSIILIAVFANMGKIRISMYEREKRRNAAAPSILGGTVGENKSHTNNKRKKKGR